MLARAEAHLSLSDYIRTFAKNHCKLSGGPLRSRQYFSATVVHTPASF